METQKQPTQSQPPAKKPAEKKHFILPRLTFIYPKLVKHGNATANTHGFVGSFNP